MNTRVLLSRKDNARLHCLFLFNTFLFVMLLGGASIHAAGVQFFLAHSPRRAARSGLEQEEEGVRLCSRAHTSTHIRIGLKCVNIIHLLTMKKKVCDYAQARTLAHTCGIGLKCSNLVDLLNVIHLLTLKKKKLCDFVSAHAHTRIHPRASAWINPISYTYSRSCCFVT